ncbi:MAG: S8 family serine peptidase [Candidatus Eisenbacteria bacterium]|nr:S8 family serine peptidase [Candidatus Eisenbacteria bacterium]
MKVRHWLVLAAAAALLSPTAAESRGESILHQAKEFRGAKASRAAVRETLDRADRVVVKFAEGSAIRLRDGRLVSLEPATDLTALGAFVTRHPEVRFERRFRRPEGLLEQERLAGSVQSGRRLADLNLYYEVILAAGSVADANAVLAELRAIDLVENAFPDPIAVPSSSLVVGRASGTDEATLGGLGSGAPGSSGAAWRDADPGLPTPDFSNMQGYLYASPSGINAQAVWGFPGGRGAGVRIVDIEGGWLWSHEDLPAPFFQSGTQINDPGWRNHGTAVLGEMVGQDNGFGVTGIASDMQAGCASIGDQSVASAINVAAAAGSVGDLFLIELHAPGPNANGSGQYGYVPMEWWQDNFDAIQTAVANGRICIEAGGNGEQNLDDPVYLNLFDRSVRNSGAIMVGAGTPTGLVAEWFTNYGNRIDLNGWGSSVTSSGYGTLQGGAEEQWYTSGFGGTSSASPIVSGAVACLQGMSKAHWGVTLNAQVATAILTQTGSPYVGSKRIGPRPDLVAARAMLLEGVGTISGLARDAETLVPLPGVRIDLPEAGSFAITDVNGQFSLPVLAGDYTLEAQEFFHQDASVPVTVGAGQNLVQDVVMDPKPTGALSGTVRAETGGAPLANAEVRLLGVPIPATTSNGAGAYSILGIPAATGYLAVAGLVPTKGAAYREVDVVANNTTHEDWELSDAQSFEANNGSYSSQTPWGWGVPTGVGPGGAFSGSKLWATNLTGNYGDSQSAYLTTPSFNFSGATRLFLSFSHWYGLEAGFDGGNVQAKNGLNWSTVSPVGEYPIAFLDGLGGEAGFSGESQGWDPVVFDLSAFVGNGVQVRFHFGSDGGVNAPGWYIDDVAFTTMSGTTDVTNPEPVAALAFTAVQPNPARGISRLEFALPTGGRTQVRIVDAGGRNVRVLLDAPLTAGRQSVQWDGRDDSGRALGAGVFFARIETGGEAIARRLVRLR